MTANVIKALEKIQDLNLFNDDLYFIGGTALSYYINHRISEDIDIAKKLTAVETKESLIKYINTKVQPLNDETVYLDEKEQSHLSFDEIKTKVLQSINECE